MKYLKFKNGDQMPAIGLGTWKLRDHEVNQTIDSALKTGYRHIDCAAVYHNEKEIGQALRKSREKHGLKREDLWITSKLWNDSHRPEDVLPALKQSLHDLQLEYLDLYLMHWPVAFKKGVDVPEDKNDFYSEKELPPHETWQAMEEALKGEYVRHLGVSNFNIGRLKELLEKGNHAPEMNQVESHPYLPQEELIEFCHSHDIHLTAYSPLGSRDRSDKMKAGDEPDLFEDHKIKALAEKYGCHPAVLLISWPVQRGLVTIPKSTDEEHMRKNLEAADIQWSEEDIKALADLEKHYRFINGRFWEREGAPFDAADLWR